MNLNELKTMQNYPLWMKVEKTKLGYPNFMVKSK